MSKISELSDGGSLQSTDYLIAVRSGGNVKVQLSELPSGIGAGGNIVFGDNEKAIFGAGSDLQIYHASGESYIEDVGTGDLSLRTNGNRVLISTTAGETMGRFEANSYAKLYYDNAEKLATTATGIDVTGTVTADGLTVASTGTPTITIQDQDGTNQRAFLKHGAGNTTVTTQNGTSHGQFQVLSYNGTDTINRIDVSSGGDISFYEDTGTTPRLFWDASEWRLGIGTASPVTRLMLEHTNDGAVGGTIRIKDRDSQQDANQLTGAIEFESEDATTPTSGVSTAIKAFAASSSGGSYLTISTTDISTSTLDERMRITSDGSFLVGTTSNRPAEFLHPDGFSVRGDVVGQIQNTVTSAQCGIFNRDGTDGEIFLFRKEGTAVGSIGTAVGSTYIDGAASSAGVYFAGASVLPRDNGSGSDGGVGLGDSSYRWKDLYLSGGAKIGTSGRTTYTSGGFYDNAASGNNIGVVTGGGHVFLSDGNGTATDNVNDLGSSSRRIKDIYVGGGVYLGGTGAANLLDDYEEGTFTPTITGATTAGTTTYTNQYGYYTKIGNTVKITLLVQYTAMTGTGPMVIGGLPFSLSNETQYYEPGVVLPAEVNWDGGSYLVALGYQNNSFIRIYYCADNGAALEQGCVNEAGNFRVSMTYRTT